MTSETLKYWMQQFVLEVIKQDGSEYPMRSFYYIVCGLSCYLKDKEVHNMNILDKRNYKFALFMRVLDAQMKKKLLSRGLGAKVRGSNFTRRRSKNCEDKKYLVVHSSYALKQCFIINVNFLDHLRMMQTYHWNNISLI